MSLWKIAWRSIQQRSLASSLTALSMALGVTLVVAVLVTGLIVDKSFQSGNGLGYNLVVGAKGGRLDLLLNSVYYLNRPIENIPWDYYKEFLPASEHKDGKKGRFADYVDLAIPICLGDVVGENGQYRVVGTTPDFFDKLLKQTAGDDLFSEGANFKPYDKQYQYATAVIGAEVSKRLNLHEGDSFKPQHGVGGDFHNAFHIVGVLNRTGTPVDRAAYINIDGFFLIPDHARGHKEEAPEAPGQDNSAEVLKEPLPEDQREVTSVLIRNRSFNGAPIELVAPELVKTINKEQVAQAIEPVREISVLNDTFVRPTRMILLGLSVMIVVVAGVGILVSIYNSMSERRHGIAVMRALGASRATVMCVVLLESILLALGGGILGWLAGHGMVAAAGPWITEYTGVAAKLLQFAPSELVLVPGLIGLATLVGLLPALAAYLTDVGKALSNTP